MRYHAFLFDLDGTLIDEFETIHRRYVHTMAQLGRPEPTLAQVRGAVGGGLESGLGKFVPAADLPEAMRIYRAFWEKTVLDGVKLMPGARELLDSLHRRGVKLGVITNKPGSSSRQICEHLKIASLVPVIVGAGDTPWLKPQPEFTAHVLQLLEAEAGTALLIGDSPYDVQAARNAGMPAWCVTTGTHTSAELAAAGADQVFPDLAALGSELLK